MIAQYIGVKMKSPNTAKKKMSTLKCVRRPLSKTIPLLDLSFSISNMWPITKERFFKDLIRGFSGEEDIAMIQFYQCPKLLFV